MKREGRRDAMVEGFVCFVLVVDSQRATFEGFSLSQQFSSVVSLNVDEAIDEFNQQHRLVWALLINVCYRWIAVRK